MSVCLEILIQGSNQKLQLSLLLRCVSCLWPIEKFLLQPLFYVFTIWFGIESLDDERYELLMMVNFGYLDNGCGGDGGGGGRSVCGGGGWGLCLCVGFTSFLFAAVK